MAVYAWGLGKSGQLGSASLDTCHLPQKVCLKHDNHKEVKYVSTGGLFSLLITNGGNVLAFGSGKHGRLGTNREENHATPVLIESLAGVTIEKVACGAWHACAIDNNHQLFAWGYGKNHGVLGFAIQGSFSAPSPVPALTSVKIIGVSCGNNFTLAWTNEGRPYSWGCGRHGVLGHGNEEDCHEPRQIEHLKEEIVVHMSAGFAHCGLITQSDKVFMFGKSRDMALGLGADNIANILLPTEVNEMVNKKTLQLSCSVGEHHGHTLAVTEVGHVYSWGDGYKGKLGQGDQMVRSKPVLIDPSNFNNEKILSISSGGIHSTAISEEGHVYTWGCGSDGRLGHPEAKGHRYLYRSDVPKLVKALEKQQVLQISTSYYHCLALIEK